MKLVLDLFLLILVINVIILDKLLSTITAKELKRRARTIGETKAAALHRMTSFGDTLHIFLWVQGALAGAILAILLAKRSWLLALVYILGVTYAVYFWHPSVNQTSWIWSWAARVAPVIGQIMNYLQPLLIQASKLIPGYAHKGFGRVYEKEDLLEFINNQNTEQENRISEDDLKMAFNALTFGDKDVSGVMTPLRKVKLVAKSELVGPLLMDELHSSGFSRFPVVENSEDEGNPTVVGTLYLKNLIGHSGKAKVAELMDKNVYFVNETQSLSSALGAFLKTHHHLFIVVNNFEEMVGVVSIEDILEQIIGSEIVDEFDKYDDLRAVASLEAKKDHKEHIESHPPGS